MAYQIRLVRPHDAPGVVRVVQAVYDEYGFTWDESGYHSDLYDLTEYCDPLMARFWVAEATNGQIIGCGGVAFHAEIPGELGSTAIEEGTVRVSRTSAEVIRMYVHPDARRQGIATEIFERILDETPGQNLEIWSDKKFIDAHRLYESFGAVRVGERICDDPDEAPEWGFLLKNFGD